MRYYLLLTLSLLLPLVLPAQQDSSAFTSDMRMKDGVFVTWSDFRWNDPVQKEEIQSSLDKEQLNFIEKALAEKVLYFTKGTVSYTVDPKHVWGFFQNNTFYVNYKGEFYRVPVFGSISYFVATVMVPTTGFYDPRFGYTGTTMYVQELREFLMDARTGRLEEMNMDRVEALLARDKEVYTEFMALGRRKRKDQLYRFIRRFNDRNPVYFLQEKPPGNN